MLPKRPSRYDDLCHPFHHVFFAELPSMNLGCGPLGHVLGKVKFDGWTVYGSCRDFCGAYIR